MSIRNLYLVLPLGAALSFAACSAESGNESTTNSTVTPGATGGAAAPTGGTGGTTTPAAPGGTTPVVTPGGAATGGTGAVTPGAAGGASPTAGTGALPGGAGTGGTSSIGGIGGTGATAGTGGAGGTGGTGGGTPLKTMCMGGETMGCSSFLLPSGKELQLGPYGAAVEMNVGKGFENTVSPSDTDSGCLSFASVFGQDEESTKKVVDSTGVDLKLYTVYRPALWKAGEKYPIITWGNGTCAQPEGYGTLLRFMASHGFVVVAANSRYVATRNTSGGNYAMDRGLDFMFAANMDMNSPYYQRLDTEKVGAAGHSQGSGATQTAASDARVKAVILYNGTGTGASKPFFLVGGDNDLAGSVSGFKSAVNGAPKAASMFFHMIPATSSFLDLSGHLTLMTQPERLTDASVAWWKVALSDDAIWKEYFVGASCKLCNRAAEFDFSQKGIN